MGQLTECSLLPSVLSASKSGTQRFINSFTRGFQIQNYFVREQNHVLPRLRMDFILWII
jgi:hypothetical protein